MTITKRIATTTLATGVLLLGGAGAAMAAPAAHTAPSAASECKTSSFRVTWPDAGVYPSPDRSRKEIDVKHSPERVTGPTGRTGEAFTVVYLGGGGVGYMDKRAVQYTGCA